MDQSHEGLLLHQTPDLPWWWNKNHYHPQQTKHQKRNSILRDLIWQDGKCCDQTGWQRPHPLRLWEKLFPFNTRAKACRDISQLYQKSGKDEDGIFNGGFHDYITKFQNLATKAKFKDKLTTCTQTNLHHNPLHDHPTQWPIWMDEKGQTLPWP